MSDTIWGLVAEVVRDNKPQTFGVVAASALIVLFRWVGLSLWRQVFHPWTDSVTAQAASFATAAQSHKEAAEINLENNRLSKSMIESHAELLSRTRSMIEEQRQVMTLRHEDLVAAVQGAPATAGAR